jgi:hypothetical protein
MNFAGLVRHSTLMIFGRAEKQVDDEEHADHSWHGPRLPIVLALSVAILIPFWPGISSVLARIADALAVSR